MYYNNTKVKIDVHQSENFFCGEGMELAVQMWTDDYYELLSIIGDDYE